MTKLVGRSKREEKGGLHRPHTQPQSGLDTDKQSAPATPEVITEPVVDISPKPRLLSSLDWDEQSPTDVWAVRSIDWDAEEIVLERKAATKSGGLRGKSLMEGAWDDADGASSGGSERGGLQSCSTCPSVVIHGHGDTAVRSSSCGCSCSTCASWLSSNHVGGHHSSSASSFSLEDVEEEKVVGARAGDDGVAGNGERRRLAGMAWLAVVLMVFSLGVIILTELQSEEDGSSLIPT